MGCATVESDHLTVVGRVIAVPVVQVEPDASGASSLGDVVAVCSAVHLLWFCYVCLLRAVARAGRETPAGRCYWPDDEENWGSRGAALDSYSGSGWPWWPGDFGGRGATLARQKAKTIQRAQSYKSSVQAISDMHP